MDWKILRLPKLLKYLKAHRFRSLSSKRIDLRPGINALVGPNGSGKTNILAALDLIGHLVELSPWEAVNKVGGIGGVFQRRPSSKVKTGIPIWKTISFEIGGSISVSIDKDQEDHEYDYTYRFQLGLSTDQNPELKNQEIRLTLVGNGSETLSPTDVLLVKETSPNIFEASSVHVNKLIGLEHLGIKKDNELKQIIEKDLNKYRWSEASLIERLSGHLFLVWLVGREIQHSERLSINPEVVRTGDDFTIDTSVLHDGSGTVKTLHALKRGRLKGKTKVECLELYNEIKHELNLAVENIRDIEITEDHLSARYMLNFTIGKTDDSSVTIPASFASEGTLKWLVLVTAIKTGVVFSLEEPENFLHPWMQVELVRLLRNDPLSELKPTIITTHSETLLNELRPNEILVTRMIDALTVVNRPNNEETLAEEIEATGFKLGYYYVAGAIDSE